jgi:YEATS domain-containing protein 4
MQGTPKVEDSQTSQTEAQAQALSISTKYPVHAWQYDEIVFADPLPNFLSILNQHTPTPLPPKNRRPRDQREDNELKSGPKKKAKPRASVSMSRDVTAEPTLPQTPGGAGSTPAPLTPAAVPPGGGMAGIHGEPGSADVPLEYSVEMEKAEWNRLNDVRIKIVEQMDKWRLVGKTAFAFGSAV